MTNEVAKIGEVVTHGPNLCDLKAECRRQRDDYLAAIEEYPLPRTAEEQQWIWHLESELHKAKQVIWYYKGDTNAAYWASVTETVEVDFDLLEVIKDLDADEKAQLIVALGGGVDSAPIWSNIEMAHDALMQNKPASAIAFLERILFPRTGNIKMKTENTDVHA